MKIKSITLKNFRQFRDTKIDFSVDLKANVSLIIGNNGTGKTTLAQAFRWCLYNETSFADKCLLNQSKFMEMNVGEDTHVTVILEIIYNKITYVFNRTRRYIKKKQFTSDKDDISLSDCVQSFSQDDSFTGFEKIKGDTKPISDPITLNNIIRQVVPPQLAPYIFFDGERIASLSKNIWQAMPNPELKKAVEIMLGLETWMNAVHHLGFEGSRNTVYANFHKQYLKVAGKKAKSLEEERDQRYSDIEQARASIKEIEQYIAKWEEQKIEQQNIIDRNRQGALLQERKRTFIVKRDDAVRQRDSQLSTMQRLFADNIFTFASRRLVLQTFESLKKVDLTDKNVPNVTSDTIDALLERGYCLCGTKLEENSPEYQALVALKKYVPPESISTTVSYFVQRLYDLYATSSKLETLNNDLDNCAAIVQQQNENENIYHQEVVNIEKQLEGGDFGSLVNNAQITIRRLDEAIRNAERKRGGFSNAIDENLRKIASITNQLQQTAKTGLEADIFERAKLYTLEIARVIRDLYSHNERYIKDSLQSEMQSIFKKINTQNMTLEIDDQYRIYSRVQGLTRTELSQAESGSVTLSFIGGILALGKKLLEKDDEFKGIIEPVPLVMDAPLSAFDMQKISSLCEIIPEISEQVIIFIKDTDGVHAKQHFGDRIGVSLEIQRSDDFNSSFAEGNF